jgi:hypothetical protein
MGEERIDVQMRCNKKARRCLQGNLSGWEGGFGRFFRKRMAAMFRFPAGRKEKPRQGAVSDLFGSQEFGWHAMPANLAPGTGDHLCQKNVIQAIRPA